MSLRLNFRSWPWCVVALAGLAGCGKNDADPATAGADGNNPAAVVSEGSGKAKQLVDEAVSLIQQRQFASAVEKLNAAITTDKNCAEAYFQRAGILADAGQDRLASVDYAKAIELNGKEVRYHNMRGLFMLTRRQHDQALEDFAAALKADPKYVQAYNNRGLVHLAKSDYKAAVEDFNKAVEIDAAYVDGFNNRGFAWYQSGSNEKALHDFNKAIELNPKYANALNNRAMLFMRVKKYRDAVKDFSSAIALDETNPKHYQNRRTAYLELGMQQQADADGDKIAWLARLNDLNTAVTKSPKDPKPYIQRASHLAKGGRSDIALANYEAAINVAPDSGDGYISRAMYYLESNEPQKAIADCSDALERKWSNKALSIRGDAYLQMGRYDDAINDYTAAKRLDTGVAEAYFRRAQQREERGNKEGARADYEVARQLDPGIGQ